MYRILPEVLQPEFYSHPFSYGEWGFTAMAVNRAVSSHHYRVDLARTGTPDSAIMQRDRMTSRAEVDEAEHHAGKSELSHCSVVVTLGKWLEKCRSNAPSQAATTSGR